jgi:transposase
VRPDPAGQEIAAAWIAKEKLRHTLNLRPRVTGSAPCERNVRDRLFAFYDWCAQNDDIPELVSLVWTISRWEDQIICAVLTGITNATSESLNRLAKFEARLAYGFRNPRISAGASASPAPAAQDAHHSPQPSEEHAR